MDFQWLNSLWRIQRQCKKINRMTVSDVAAWQLNLQGGRQPEWKVCPELFHFKHIHIPGGLARSCRASSECFTPSGFDRTRDHEDQEVEGGDQAPRGQLGHSESRRPWD